MSWKVEKRAPQVKYAACDHLSLAISTPNSCVVFARFFNRERNLRVGLYLFIEIKRQLKILIHLFPKNIAADIVAYLTSNRSEC